MRHANTLGTYNAYEGAEGGLKVEVYNELKMSLKRVGYALLEGGARSPRPLDAQSPQHLTARPLIWARVNSSCSIVCGHFLSILNLG